MLAQSGWTTLEYAPTALGGVATWILLILVVAAYYRSG